MALEYLPSKKLLDLPFDQFSRQYLVKQLVEVNRSKKKLRILDIGGYKGKTKEFFPKDQVTVIDLFDVREKDYVKGSALEMPFEDGAFDVIVSFDVFEHIYAKDRVTFMKEATRVSANIVVIAAPFNTSGVAAAEKELNDYYKTGHNGENHRWLLEHIENGLPDLEATKRFFTQKQINYVVLTTNPLWLWYTLQSLIFLADAVESPALITGVNRYYNESLNELDTIAGDSYRNIVFTKKDGAISQPQPHTPTDQTQPVRSLMNRAFTALSYIARDNKVTRAQKSLVTDQIAEIERLHGTLADIYNSPSWKVARALRGIKRRLLFKK